MTDYLAGIALLLSPYMGVFPIVIVAIKGGVDFAKMFVPPEHRPHWYTPLCVLLLGLVSSLLGGLLLGVAFTPQDWAGLFFVGFFGILSAMGLTQAQASANKPETPPIDQSEHLTALTK